MRWTAIMICVGSVISAQMGAFNASGDISSLGDTMICLGDGI